MANIEDKTVEQSKPDWKQWIPFYGIYKITSDDDKGKPTIWDKFSSNNNPFSLKGFEALMYHPIVDTALGLLLCYGLDRLCH